MTGEQIDTVYRHYGEPQPIEGRARADLLVAILQNSPWSRVLEQPARDGGGWHLQLHLARADAVPRLQTFARLALAGGQPGMQAPCWANGPLLIVDPMGYAAWRGALGSLLGLVERLVSFGWQAIALYSQGETDDGPWAGFGRCPTEGSGRRQVRSLP